MENPADIIYHFIEKELGHIDIVNIDSWLNARTNSLGWDLAFSLTEKIKAKDLMKKYDISEGKLLGIKLKKIEEKWINNNFKVSEIEISQVLKN